MSYNLTLNNQQLQLSLARTGGQGTKGDSITSASIDSNGDFHVIISNAAGQQVQDINLGGATIIAEATAAKTAAEAALDTFDDRFLGVKSSAPGLDNDNDALVTGALYFDSTISHLGVYNGSSWIYPLQAAQTSATAAAASASAASTSETNAATSATNAGTSATNAANSAAQAASSESSVSADATTASTAATNALASQSAAATSAANAATSETNAGTSETNAANSATSAASDATYSNNRANAAAASAAAALVSENNSATSESSAASSATTAGNHSANAAANAVAANSSKIAAASSESNALNYQSGAQTAETNAASSATAAANSASAASTSETNAASSATSAATSLASVQTVFDNFDDKFLGTKTSDPTVDNDGDALVEGAMYYNSTTDAIKFYNGTSWEAPSIAASNSATAAATSASNAASSATNSASSATASANSAASSLTSANNAAASYDSFDDRYLGAKASDPTVDNDGDALLTGAIYFDTTNDVMKVYNGTDWQNASSSIEGIKTDFIYTATANQTVFSGSDNNSNILAIDKAGLLSLFMNGIRLIQGTDYTVNVGGDSVTLTSGAAANDVIEIQVFGNFTGQSGAEVAITGGSITGLSNLGMSGSTTVTGILDEDDMVSNSNVKLATQQSIKAYVDSSILTKDNTDEITEGSTNLYYTDARAQAVSINNVVEDTTPQLGGNLDLNSNNITGTGNLNITGTVTSDGLTVDGNVTSDSLTVSRIGDSSSALITIDTDATTHSMLRFQETSSDVWRIVKEPTNELVIDSGAGEIRARFDTNGDISFYEDTGTTAKFFWDASAERLGIGTASPETSLHIFQTSASAILRLHRSGATNAADAELGQVEFFNADGSNDGPNVVAKIVGSTHGTNGSGGNLRFFTHDGSEGGEGSDPVERLKIDGSGNVGIGTSSVTSGFKLDVVGDARFSDVAGDDGVELGWSAGGSAGFVQAYDRGASAFRDLKLNNAVTINSSGNVGIGTDSPSNVLHVHQSDASSNSYVHITHADGGSAATDGLSIGLESNGINAAIRNRENGYLRMYTNNTEAMRIDSNGQVGINASSPSSFSGSRLVVKPSAGDAGTNDVQSWEYTSFSAGSEYDLRLQQVVSSGLVKHQFNVRNAGTDYTSNLVLDRGNVGIGTSSPSRQLSLYGSAPYMAFQNATTGAGSGDGLQIQMAGSDAYIWNYENSFMAFGTNGTEAMRIDSSGNVGIGTSSPSESLTNRGNIFIETNSTSADSGNGLFWHSTTNGWSTSTAHAAIYGKRTDASNGYIRFDTRQSGTTEEAMRIDSSGNLLVGKTSLAIGVVGTEIRAGGQLLVTADGDNPADFNRETSDGVIALFRKDGSTVGSIGTSGDDLTVGNDVTTVKFHNGLNTIHPNGTGSGSDGLTTLGWTNNRFKDLYLSGGVYLGGTGSANKLDDYEEGTWTPVVYDTNTSGHQLTLNNVIGKYKKIGNWVNCTLQVGRNDATSLSGVITITNLPFTVAAQGSATGGTFWLDKTSTDRIGVVYVVPSADRFYLLSDHAVDNYLLMSEWQNARPIYIQVSYNSA